MLIRIAYNIKLRKFSRFKINLNGCGSDRTRRTVRKAEVSSVLQAQETAAVQSHTKMFRACFCLSKRFRPAPDQFSGKTGAIVYNRKEQGIFLCGKNYFYFCSGKAYCICNQIFRCIQKYPMVNSECSCIRHRNHNIQSRGK